MQSLLWHGASQWRILLHRMWVQLSTTCCNLLTLPNGELLVAVDHNQLRTMASETVDPIDWSHPPPYTGQYPWASLIAQCSAGCKSQDLLHSVSIEWATFGMPGQRTTCAATQGTDHSGNRTYYETWAYSDLYATICYTNMVHKHSLMWKFHWLVMGFPHDQNLQAISSISKSAASLSYVTLLLLLFGVRCARPGEHFISAKTSTPHNEPMEGRRR